MKYDKSISKVYRNLDEWIADCYGSLPNEAMLEEQYNALPDVTISYDSEPDTLKHIRRVNELLLHFAMQLMKRAQVHDNSKLGIDEKPMFDTYTPLLKGMTYDSPEYKQCLSQLQLALNHHYKENSHHPEHYKNGVNDMDLLDIMEMFIDWKAATERHADGDIIKSIEINKSRFGISDQLSLIFQNTVKHFAS